MILRRQFAKVLGSIGTLVSLSGCIGTRWWEDDDDEERPTGGTDNRSQENTTSEGPADTDNTSERGTERKNASETTSKDSTKRQQHPDENATQINRDEYNETYGEYETTTRDPSDVEITADAQQTTDSSLLVTGTATNVSDRAINVVDIEVIFYGTNDAYLSATLVTVRDLEPGENHEFEIQPTTGTIEGTLERIEVNRTVYDVTD
ncbi:FxLYD domain-containing protein [Halalkalicoccus subterraneus]|uniref:FxLYD domain-containing protein n=1 Tax=Halalkalicoccus subterraneus TaxID=2675002 RepID=UPI000EFA88E8|nr:FxLYD domain-containing protein [Halalkalicoccus subterraneus]